MSAAPEASAARQDTKKEMLKTPPEEARELEQLIASGHGAHNRVGFLTFLGVLLVGAAAWYWHVDRLPGAEWGARPYPEHLHQQIRGHEEKCLALRPGERLAPTWPAQVYAKLRTDLFLLAALVLLLAFVFTQVERAKATRESLLVYRSLAREIEKLRLREKGKADEPAGPDAGA